MTKVKFILNIIFYISKAISELTAAAEQVYDVHKKYRKKRKKEKNK